MAQPSLSAKISEQITDYKAALAQAPYANDSLVGKETAAIVKAGHSILQIHKLADDDGGHVRELLNLVSPPEGAIILDAGCGVGRVAELMSRERPDLRFMLLNISRAQLDMCPPRFPTIHADFHSTGMADGSVNVVMFNYSLGHGLLRDAIGEAARVLKCGGILFIYDLSALDSRTLIDALGYKAHAVDDVCRAAADAGLTLDFHNAPTGTKVADFISLVGADAYADIFRGVLPAVYRFVKC